jgi:hypothetical protein
MRRRKNGKKKKKTEGKRGCRGGRRRRQTPTIHDSPTIFDDQRVAELYWVD